MVFFLNIKILIVLNMNVCIFLFSPHNGAAIVLIEFLLPKLPCFLSFAFVCVYVFVSIFARAYFIIGLWAVE
jgi:hypothetical protein